MGDSDLSAEILLLQWTYSMLGNPLQLDSKEITQTCWSYKGRYQSTHRPK